MDDDAWAKVLSLGAFYRNPATEVPVTETRVSNGHTMCFACIHHIEGCIRTLARSRRRPKSSLPAHLVERSNEKPPPFGEIGLRVDELDD